MEGYFNFLFMARFILGRSSRSISKEKMQDFIEKFTELQILYFLPKIKETFFKSEESCFNFTKTFSKNRRTVVHINFHQSNQSDINFAFYIKELPADIFRIYDMQVENIRLLLSWRSEYQSIIRRKGFDGLMALLNDKILVLKN